MLYCKWQFECQWCLVRICWEIRSERKEGLVN